MDDNTLIVESQKLEQQKREWGTYRLMVILLTVFLCFATWQATSCETVSDRECLRRINACEKRLHQAYVPTTQTGDQ